MSFFHESGYTVKKMEYTELKEFLRERFPEDLRFKGGRKAREAWTRYSQGRKTTGKERERKN